MPKNPNFDPNSNTVTEVFKSAGVFSDGTNNSEMFAAYFDTNPAYQGLYVVMPSGEYKYFDIEMSAVGSSSDGTLLGFSDENGSYELRTVVSDDGVWMSKYKIFLPTDVLQDKIVEDSHDAISKYTGISFPNVDGFSEDLFVYYSDNSSYIDSVIYSCSEGAYFRDGGDWTSTSISDDSLNDLYVQSVDPDKASQLIDLFDDKDGNLPIDSAQFALLTDDSEISE
jgi:hypothetical protein